MIGDVKSWAVVDRGAVSLPDVVNAGRYGVVEVSLPQPNVDVESGCKRRNLHVVGPLSRLSHPLEVQLEVLLELLLAVDGPID